MNLSLPQINCLVAMATERHRHFQVLSATNRRGLTQIHVEWFRVDIVATYRNVTPDGEDCYVWEHGRWAEWAGNDVADPVCWVCGVLRSRHAPEDFDADGCCNRNAITGRTIPRS